MQQIPLESIRHAVNSGEFDRAQLLWNQYAAGLADELSNRCLSVARLAEVHELVEWSRTVVLCERAHLRSKLNRTQSELRVTGEYGIPASPRTPRLVTASF
jgi:hypothetical protein